MTQAAQKLAGRIALVTGASRAIAQRFAAEGATVVVAARSLEQTLSLPGTLAETALALCQLPACERTGLIAHSLHFPLAHRLPVYTLDVSRQNACADDPGVGASGHSAGRRLSRLVARAFFNLTKEVQLCVLW